MQRTNESRRLALIIVSALVVLLASSALRVQGQTVFGRISGTVKDPNAAAVPNAMVTITNLATNLVRTTTTDSDGFYTVTNLPVGNYSVEAEQGGFKKAAQSGISVVADARLTVDITLEPGQVTETVQITTGAGETVQVRWSLFRARGRVPVGCCGNRAKGAPTRRVARHRRSRALADECRGRGADDARRRGVPATPRA